MIWRSFILRLARLQLYRSCSPSFITIETGLPPLRMSSAKHWSKTLSLCRENSDDVSELLLFFSPTNFTFELAYHYRAAHTTAIILRLKTELEWCADLFSNQEKP